MNLNQPEDSRSLLNNKHEGGCDNRMENAARLTLMTEPAEVNNREPVPQPLASFHSASIPREEQELGDGPRSPQKSSNGIRSDITAEIETSNLVSQKAPTVHGNANGEITGSAVYPAAADVEPPGLYSKYAELGKQLTTFYGTRTAYDDVTKRIEERSVEYKQTEASIGALRLQLSDMEEALNCQKVALDGLVQDQKEAEIKMGGLKTQLHLD